MSDKTETTLRDGTLVRHRSNGYQGKIEGTTSIRACFTRGGTSVQTATSKETFQYRILVAGESMRWPSRYSAASTMLCSTGATTSSGRASMETSGASPGGARGGLIGCRRTTVVTFGR